MRVLVSLLVVATILLGTHALVVGDGLGADRSSMKVERRLKALELEVEYLRLRDEALTRYMLANRERGKALDLLAKRVRELGFENKAIPAPSRVQLLSGLEQIALNMATDLPERTAEEDLILRRLDATLK